VKGERIKWKRRHPKMTFGTEVLGIRITRGRLDRHGRFHDNQPCVFVLWRGRRIFG
jgi:hypothetical protein